MDCKPANDAEWHSLSGFLLYKTGGGMLSSLVSTQGGPKKLSNY